MNDLREDLDRALRAVPLGDAPVERAKRGGRRIRTRRRAALLAGALAVVAVAAGYPALIGGGVASGPSPATGSGKPTPSAGHDMVVTAVPPVHATEAPAGLTDKTGQIAVGAIGDMKWQIAVVPPGKKSPVPDDSCYTITILVGASDIQGGCTDIPAILGKGLGEHKPAAFTQFMKDGTTATTVGEVAPDVTYFILSFSDGQQLKLLPVTASGHRYIAWMAPLSMAIDSMVAHIGGPYSDGGLTATAVPFEQPAAAPVFGLWQLAGQTAPPRDTQVIGGGTTGGQPWKVTAYEGPWGTCFVTFSDTGPVGSECVQATQLDTTTILGWGDVTPVERGFGSAAPGVAAVRITMSDGRTVTAHPVGVGNQDLLAFPTGTGVSPVRWTAYDASGKQVGQGTVRAGTANPTRS